MDLPDELFTLIFNIPNDEKIDIDSMLILEPVTNAPTIGPNTIERALEAVDKYLQENGDESEDIINGPNVHDCY